VFKRSSFSIKFATRFQMHQDLLFSQVKANYSGIDFTCVSFSTRGRRRRDRIVVGFTTTYAINVYHHWCCEFEFWSWLGVQHYVIKFVSDLRCFFPGPLVSSSNKTDRQDITELLLKVALNTIKPTNQSTFPTTHLNKSSNTFDCSIKYWNGDAYMDILNRKNKKGN